MIKKEWSYHNYYLLHEVNKILKHNCHLCQRSSSGCWQSRHRRDQTSSVARFQQLFLPISKLFRYQCNDHPQFQRIIANLSNSSKIFLCWSILPLEGLVNAAPPAPKSGSSTLAQRLSVFRTCLHYRDNTATFDLASSCIKSLFNLLLNFLCAKKVVAFMQ